ncbi:WAT1-related protein [Glycine soja]
MSNNEGAFGVMYVKLKPHLLMVLVQLVLSFLYFLVEASLNKAMNPHVFVTYRHAVGGIVVLPFAYIRERLEVVDVKNTRGLAKVFGTVLSLIGALIMTLYEGHTIHSLQGAPLHVRGNLVHKNWIKGSILSVASCISWSLWYILQAIIVKKYPAQLSLTAWINCMGAAQSAAFTGVICGGFVIFSQFWTAEQKGPVFVSMFNPLGAILVAILAYFVFGEQLYTDR